MKKQWWWLLVEIFGCLFTAVNPVCAQTWTPTSAPSNGWASVAGSANGSKWVAAVNGGGIYTSTNSGATWMLTSAPNASWTCVASSADGTRLAAVSAEGMPRVYISTNSGATWDYCAVLWVVPVGYACYWSAVCLSADGTRLAVAADSVYLLGNLFPGPVYTSTNSGATWKTGPTAAWSSVTCAADGNKFVAAAHGGGIYTSTNAGATWTQTSAGNANWNCVASSADGTRLAAASEGMPVVYRSTNSGATWNACPVLQVIPVGYFCYWSSVCLSADGARLAVAAKSVSLMGLQFPGKIYTSTNSGTSWTAGPAAAWSSVAGSADGSRWVAAVDGGGIYLCQRTTEVQCLSLTCLTDTLVLSWLVPSTNFQVQQNLDLNTTNWTDVTNLTSLEGQVTLPMAAPRGFYRLETR
jgi:hypothetical protein